MDITLALAGAASAVRHTSASCAHWEAHGFTVKAIAGTSALLGVLHACGKTPDELESVISNLDGGKLFTRDKKDGPSRSVSPGWSHC